MTRLHETMSRRQKAVALLLMDGAFMVIAILVGLQLRLGEWWPNEYFADGAAMFLIIPLVGMGLSWIMGIPRIILRTFEHQALFRLGQFAVAMSILFAVLNTVFSFGFPRSIPGIWAAVFLFFAIFGRLAILDTMRRLNADDRKNVLVYGAGSAGQRLVAALRSSPDVNPIGFLDNNIALKRVAVAGLKVHLPDTLPHLIKRLNVQQVILAMPSINRRERQTILDALKQHPVEVETLPTFEEMLDGRALPDQLRPVSVDDLLGRDAVDLRSDEIASVYKGKNILVTGAGGSIGSELTRQLLEAGPAKLVLFDQSEFALYSIDMELRSIAGNNVEVIPVLGSVTDARRVSETLSRYSIDVVLHAAAYKHVPMIEDNPLEGARNNIIGTQVMADAAISQGVARFILVSTDKAVRPTNVMGATKRMAEMVIQDRQTRSNFTKLTMVRFGNVLGSSGSVIPLFREQIKRGGPVTLTHKDVTRYFMTIPEAAQLVLLAGSFAEGGEVYVLDMGKSVRIYDLARSLIELTGFSVRDDHNPDGDIEIQITGLRPGEKLYEELLIGDGATTTPHPKIMRAAEGHLSNTQTAAALARIQSVLGAGDGSKLPATLREYLD